MTAADQPDLFLFRSVSWQLQFCLLACGLSCGSANFRLNRFHACLHIERTCLFRLKSGLSEANCDHGHARQQNADQGGGKYRRRPFPPPIGMFEIGNPVEQRFVHGKSPPVTASIVPPRAVFASFKLVSETRGRG